MAFELVDGATADGVLEVEEASVLEDSDALDDGASVDDAFGADADAVVLMNISKSYKKSFVSLDSLS